jgi:pantetheine-phosphate adenylyltransferase
MNRYIAVYAGSFDPVTNGHLDVIHRALKCCDQLHVVIASSSEKRAMFSVGERQSMLLHECSALEGVVIASHSGLTVDYCRKVGAKLLIRGLRSGADYTFEMAMAQMNRHLAPDVETLFLPTNSEYFHVSSSLVKDVARHKGDLGSLVPTSVAQKIAEKIIQ